MEYQAYNDCNDFLIEFYLRENENKIIASTIWNKRVVHINHGNKESLIIETEKSHWIFVNIVNKILNYADFCIKDVPGDIIEFAKKNNLRLKQVPWKNCLKNGSSNDCLKYSLYVIIQMIRFNSEADPKEIINDKESLETFIKDFNSCKSQLRKVKEKVKLCSNLFLTFTEEMPAITDFKHALHFIYFVESLALQDNALNNKGLKDYIINIIGSENVELVRKIRFWLLHREKGYFIFPQQLHKFTLQENNSRKVFEKLQKYLEYVYERLCGREVNTPKESLEVLIFFSKELGNKLDEEDISLILEDLSFGFINEVLSLKKTKTPEKILFNFIVNFIPLLQVLHRKIKSLENLINFRNHLVHNIYILYQNSIEVPYITFQNMLNDVREILLKFNFCSKVARELKNISETEEIKLSKEKIETCLKRLKKQFPEELKKQPEIGSFVDEKAYLHYLIDKIESYFRSLLIVDFLNKTTLKNIPIEKFELPKFCYRFSQQERNAMFQKFNIMKEIKQSDLSEGSRKALEKSIKEDLNSYGLKDSEYNLILKSVLNSKNFDNEKIIKEILKHISNVMKLNENSKYDLTTVINDYSMYLENNPNFNFKKYKKIKLQNFTDKTFEINITYGSFYVNLSGLLKNFFPFYFNMAPNYANFENLESILQDREVVELLSSCNISNMRNIKLQINNLPSLAPLGVELLCGQKMELKKFEQRDFIMLLAGNLLKFENGSYFLNRLFSFKIKDCDFNFSNECLELVFNINLIKGKSDKLNSLFSIPDIQKKLHSILKSKLLREDYIDILKRFLNYQYNLTYELYEIGNYEKALELVDEKKVGLSPFLKEVMEKDLRYSEKRVIEIKFLIAKVKFQMGFQSHEEEKQHSYLESSLRILQTLMCSLPNSSISKNMKIRWELRIKSLQAYILHLLGKCKESGDQYKEIFLKLYNLNVASTTENVDEQLFSENGFITDKNLDLKTGIENLLNSEEYISAVKLNNRNLNIFQIMTNHGKELFCQIRFLEKTNQKVLCFKDFLRYLDFLFAIKRKIIKKENYPYWEARATYKEIEQLLLKYKMAPLLKKILSRIHFEGQSLKTLNKKVENLRKA